MALAAIVHAECPICFEALFKLPVSYLCKSEEREVEAGRRGGFFDFLPVPPPPPALDELVLSRVCRHYFHTQCLSNLHEKVV